MSKNAEINHMLDRIIDDLPPEDRRESIAALIVHAMKNPAIEIDMFGAKITAEPDGVPGRNEVFILPYNRTGSGANVIVACTVGEQEYFIVAQKFADPRNPGKGLSSKVILPGGYMQPALPITQIGYKGETRSSDFAEELVLLGIPLKDAYAQAAAQINNVEIRKFDPDMIFCAVREAHEETGLPMDVLLRARAVLVGQNSRHGYSNAEKLHVVALNVMLDLGELKELPLLSPGSDVGVVWWGMPEDVTYAYGEPRLFSAEDSRYSIKVRGDQEKRVFRDDHAEAADDAIKCLRDHRLLKNYGIGLSTLEAHIGATVTNMGESGREHFNEVKRLAEGLAPVIAREVLSFKKHGPLQKQHL